MSDLFEDPEPGATAGNTAGNAPEFTVSELSGAVKRVVEGEFGRVRVRGEVGRVSMPRSGHVYFDLKDDRSVLAAVSWKGQAARLTVKPEEGMEVIATGRMTTFPGQSKYQLIVDDIVPAGAGALMAMLEKLRQRLAAEGLFAAERKRPLPYLPQVIGVVTSPSGAVIRDILHRLRDRFPRHVLIWPVAVQGERCAPEVAAAIRGFNAIEPGGPVPRPDVLIVARGGGSLEDLWGFNDEAVVRAAAESRIPLISAVGHETDTTLIDHAADRRAPTPTAAAEMAVPVRRDLLSALDAFHARLGQATSRGLDWRGQRLRDLGRLLPQPEALTQAAGQRLDLWSGRLLSGLTQATGRKRAEFNTRAAHVRPRLLTDLTRRLAERVQTRADRLAPALTRQTAQGRRDLGRLSQRLAPDTLLRDAGRKRADLDRLTRRLTIAAEAQTQGWRTRLDALDRMRATLGYQETLKRGFAVVRGDGHVVTSKSAAEAAQSLEIEFHDGRLTAGAATPAPSRAAPKKPKEEPPEQGSLF
ncbi:exodeoxyribonuclease VII large subunit [Acidimangrovimonas sediminis]|uniref:exodeoxyribonuclease VII large subunit n=1 Tax=Acidimangrovimonas sediminis TaxID=2056283 RepID=UPI000C7FB970|nr:exodeoxyribonuclease VII large subunit [Acidimangrovimonas sediminis]